MTNERIPVELRRVVSEAFDCGVALTTVGENRWEFKAPFGDQHGDPLSFSIGYHDNQVTVNDKGAVAGLLFSLGQDEDDTPGIKLLSALARSNNLVVDYDFGLVRTSCPLNELFDTLPTFARVVLTLLTASPHLERRQSRSRTLGRRLSSRIKAHYEKEGIDRYVERTSHIPGVAVQQWPADFHWKLAVGRRHQNVFTLAADLDIKNPLVKAHRVSSLALDTRYLRPDDELRVVINTGENNDGACQAAKLIREHSPDLKYTVYDFDDDRQRGSFLERAVMELTSERAREWRGILSRVAEEAYAS